MNKETRTESYQFGVKIALDSCGLVKTAAVPGWLKGMVLGAPAGAGVGAIAGGDPEDILSGALGGAALGGTVGGGGFALGRVLRKKLISAELRAAEGLAAQAKGRLRAAEDVLTRTGRPPGSYTTTPQDNVVSAARDAWTKAERAAARTPQGRAANLSSPALLSALGLTGGGLGIAGAVS